MNTALVLRILRALSPLYVGFTTSTIKQKDYTPIPFYDIEIEELTDEINASPFGKTSISSDP